MPLRIGRARTPGIITRMAANNCVTIGAKPKLGTMLGILALKQDLAKVDIGTTPPWASFAASNSPTPRQKVPVLIAQTRDDPLVAPAVTRAFARKLCANRVRVRWLDLPGGDHATTAKASAGVTLDWIDRLFAGKAVGDDCARL